MIGITRSVAVDYAPEIRSNAILPGAILTKTWDNINIDEANPYITRCPMRRLGQPDDIASAVVFLASDEAKSMTGSAYNVDLGYTAS